MTTKELVDHIVNTLENHKALDIKDINVTHLTDVTDNVVICTATSNRHAKTLAEKVCRSCKDIGHKPYHVEGEEEAQWVLIDLHDVVVHIMLKTARDFYSLEKLWSLTESSRQNQP